MQIQKYKNIDENPQDRNPFNHSKDDTYAHVNQDYFFEQAKATTAFAGHLAEPIIFKHFVRQPVIWSFKY